MCIFLFILSLKYNGNKILLNENLKHGNLFRELAKSWGFTEYSPFKC